MTLEEFAQRRVSRLIGRAVEQASRLAEATDAEAIHDLRVAVRRLTQNLRLFSRVFGKKACRAVRTDLKALMDLAGEARTRDIALELFDAAGIGRNAAPCVRLMLEREEAIKALAAHAADWKEADAANRWKKRLGLA